MEIGRKEQQNIVREKQSYLQALRRGGLEGREVGHCGRDLRRTVSLPPVRRHDSGARPEDVKKFVKEFRSAFSDIEDIVEDMIGEGVRVVTRWTLRVTHTGEFRGIPTTGKRITLTGIGIFRFSEEGKVEESWDSLDELRMLRQLGVSAT